MSKVFLLATNTTTDPYPVYPLGMAVVARALTDAGHEVRQFDFLVSGRDTAGLASAIKQFAPDCVGLSLRNIDNVDSFSGESGWYLTQARELTQLCREASGAPVIIGGPAFSIMPEEILDYLGADFGIVGEGEKAFPELLARLTRGEQPERITRSSGPGLTGRDMAQPLLVRELVDFYVGGSGMVNLQTKRGCPFKCVYCTYPCIEGRVLRLREPEAVVEDLARMNAEFAIDHVFFTDSVFNDPGGHYLEVAEALIKSGLNIKWSAFFKPMPITAGELALLKRSGLYAVELGTDASCDATLAGLDKSFSFAEALAFNQACVAQEIPVAHFVMFAGPGETMDTVREGLANLERLEQCVVFAFSGIRILPGTRLLDIARAEGVLADDMPLLKPAYYFSPHVDVQAMHEAMLTSFAGRRERIFPPSEGQARMEVMQRFGYRGLMWDKLISFRKDKPRRVKT
ncbi:lipid biosynthesis B12-binding/radical SAM protein [Desulfocurvibacter africanus]|uniref:lipid biosynthesis B12-binding/radical SAM protein n=1 Tax=Desulfocurvibacter africanus TaxID=873 RepID=UPI002FDB7D9B